MNVSRRARNAALVLSVTATACGGHGGGGGSHPPTPPTTAPTTSATKALWIANGTDVVEYLPSQLGTGTGDLVPHLTLNSTSFGSPQGVQFDTAGNLWVIDGGTAFSGGTALPALYKFTAAQLAQLANSPTQTPSVTINSIGFRFPQQAVFDKSGNLWVSDNGAATVDEFSSTQIVGGGDITPNITLSANPALNGPLGIAFDSTGDLFVADNGGTSIDGFFSSTLPQTGSVRLTPNIVLSDDGQKSIQAPWALVFDANGNLWSSNANPPSTIVEFSKSALVTSGSPVPAVTLSPATVNGNTTLAAPNGIAFDPAGNLAAVSAATPFGVAIFARTQLSASGTTVPATFIQGTATTLSAPAGDVYGPVVN